MLGAGALLVAVPLAAQDLASTRVGVSHTDVAPDSIPLAALHVAEAAARSHPLWPFVVGGAAAGATAAGLVMANGIRHTDDAMVFPQVVVAFVAVGAAVGALGGWIVGAAVR
jgi:hypothetical protein